MLGYPVCNTGVMERSSGPSVRYTVAVELYMTSMYQIDNPCEALDPSVVSMYPTEHPSTALYPSKTPVASMYPSDYPANPWTALGRPSTPPMSLDPSMISMSPTKLPSKALEPSEVLVHSMR
jgi:hypothetical protein